MTYLCKNARDFTSLKNNIKQYSILNGGVTEKKALPNSALKSVFILYQIGCPSKS